MTRLPPKPIVITLLATLLAATAASLIDLHRPSTAARDAARPPDCSPPVCAAPTHDDAHPPQTTSGPPPPPKPPPPKPPPEAATPTMPRGAGGAPDGDGGSGRATAQPSEVVAQPSLLSVLTRPLTLLCAAVLAGAAAALVLIGYVWSSMRKPA